MKLKIFILLIALLGATNIGKASFPVQKKEAVQVNTTSHIVSNSAQEVAKESLKPSQLVSDDYSSPAAGGGKSQLIALLLVFFVGILGVHRFYLGYTWQGVVQLLTMGGCGVWALIDLIRIITGDLKPKDGDYTDKL